MGINMIILLAVFVWAPMMGYLGFKYVQTYSERGRSTKRRARRPMIPTGDEPVVRDETRRRIYRRT